MSECTSTKACLHRLVSERCRRLKCVWHSLSTHFQTKRKSLPGRLEPVISFSRITTSFASSGAVFCVATSAIRPAHAQMQMRLIPAVHLCRPDHADLLPGPHHIAHVHQPLIRQMPIDRRRILAIGQPMLDRHHIPPLQSLPSARLSASSYPHLLSAAPPKPAPHHWQPRTPDHQRDTNPRRRPSAASARRQPDPPPATHIHHSADAETCGPSPDRPSAALHQRTHPPADKTAPPPDKTRHTGLTAPLPLSSPATSKPAQIPEAATLSHISDRCFGGYDVGATEAG